MTILQITPSYKPAFVYGGPIYSVSALCEAQASLENKVIVFATNANGATNLDIPLNAEQNLNNVGVYYFPRITGDHTHISPKMWLRLFFGKKKYDVIHLHSWWSLLMIGCAWILFIKRVRFVISPRGMFSSYSFTHNNNPFKKKIFFDFLSKTVLKHQVFHATALSEQLEIKNLFGEKTKVFTLPNLLNFPNLPLSSIQTHGSDNEVKLLFISRVDKKKGIEILLNAIKELKHQSINIKLTIIGSGSEEYQNQLKNLCKEFGIDELIIWKGSVEWNEKFNDILNTNILVLPSYNENFANIVLETLYAGRPVIVTKYVGLSDYVSTHKMGWVIDTNPADIVASVKEYISQKSFWQSKALEMHNQIKKDYNAEELAKKYIEAYKLHLNIE
jgi:glycosyltransferase involved in cell wall biosynthesis